MFGRQDYQDLEFGSDRMHIRQDTCRASALGMGHGFLGGLSVSRLGELGSHSEIVGDPVWSDSQAVSRTS